ncbi:MAG: cysteine--tRNA ligase [Micavibrio sp.]|nr:cysteine--tRNA ligase [Micavibrio sp.]
MLKLYNSLTRTKEDFVPIDPDNVRLYACGPTVYDYAHIGNARMAVVFDLLRTVLSGLYPNVTYVSNITDIDDKIMKAAAEQGVPIKEITEKYTQIYNEDLDALGVEEPDIQPKATEHVDDMIAYIEALIADNYAYEAEGHVLFHVPAFPKYGGLSGRSRDDQIAGARVEVAPFKKDPADFVLWKPSSDDQPGWDSPWGRGRPGWHIECSAMSAQHLGLPFDIHGGGADLKFPHHENEIAQSVCAHGHPDDLSSFAKFWVHNGFLTVEGEKMSKSLGNFTLTHDLLEQGVEGEAIRLAMLSAHYRQPLDWTKDKVEQSKKTLDRFYGILISQLDANVQPGVFSDDFLNAIYDDLNTPKAIAELHALAKDIEKDPDDIEGLSAFVNGGLLLGLFYNDPEEWLAPKETTLDEAYILEQIAARQSAKDKKDFTLSDKIRDDLAAQGIVLKDSPDGTSWSVE